MTEAEPAAKTKGGGRKKLLIPLLALLLLGGGGAGAWFSGVLPRLLGKGDAAAAEPPKPGHGAPDPAKPEPPKPAHGAPDPAKPAHGAADPAKGGHGADPKAAAGKSDGSPFMDLPEIVSNLNGGARRATFLKLKAKLELARPEDQALIQAAMPRVLDLFQGYLREMRPEELRGTAGTYRLREELLARTNLAVPGARVVAVLFTEILVQ